MSLKNNAFWKNKSVLVTGANGFVGSHLTKDLILRGANVVGISRTAKLHPLLETDAIKKKTKIVKNSSLNLNELAGIINKFNISIVFHLAGQTTVETGRESPTETFEVNIRGTWNMLEAARINNIHKIVIASTTHVYGDNPNLPYKEEYFPQPSRPYETSKACADLLAQSYADTYSLPVEIPRFVNIYGPGDLNFSRLVPRVILSILKGKNPHIWDVGAVRDFLYIDDAIQAYLKLAEKKLPNNKRNRIFNFGYGEPVKIINIIKKIIKLSGNKKIKIITQSVPGDREKEIKKQYISIDKAVKELSWVPHIDIDTGLEQSLAWYRTNLHL